LSTKMPMLSTFGYDESIYFRTRAAQCSPTCQIRNRPHFGWEIMLCDLADTSLELSIG
jgi:hypothetical protein